VSHKANVNYNVLRINEVQANQNLGEVRCNRV